MKHVDLMIAIWSMRPAPGSPEGKAWVRGAHQGWKWAAQHYAKSIDEYSGLTYDEKRIVLGVLEAAGEEKKSK